MQTATTTRLIIDDTILPSVPNAEEGWKIFEHRGHEQSIEWDSEKIETVLVLGQGNGLKGHEIKKEILKFSAGNPVFDGCNATVLESLFKHFKDHPGEIPTSFKPTGDAHYKCTVFWWTLYTTSQEDKFFVRGLMVFRDGKCQLCYINLDQEFGIAEPAVVFKK